MYFNAFSEQLLTVSVVRELRTIGAVQCNKKFGQRSEFQRSACRISECSVAETASIRRQQFLQFTSVDKKFIVPTGAVFSLLLKFN